ncbi:MAG: lytic transglycosylase domain-containing protein [Chloracidobacterium sp.]|nr:lytic transglycosylase domain-containing protein [Chloracidobacterium sp.]
MTAAIMQSQSKFAGSMTSLDEVKYLRGIALENAGRRNEALAMFGTIADVNGSFYGGLASEKINTGRVKRIAKVTATNVDFPVLFREEVLQETKKRKIDPRFILAIMKQESSFRADAKSQAAARGLLQLVYDTALKYNQKAGFPSIQPDDLYDVRTNIAIGCEYIAALKEEFGGLYEAIAASYNGGEDNAARWWKRSKPKEPGIFAAEVGFAETKDYVFKVMKNYRIYRELYDENLSVRSPHVSKGSP